MRRPFLSWPIQLAILGCAIALLVLLIDISARLDRIEHHVHCISDPTPAGAASTTARLRPDGTIETGPTHRTGCP